MLMGFDTDTVGGRLQQRLADLGISQADLARRLGINPQRITHWIKRNSVSKSMLFEVCTILRCRPEWLELGALPAEPFSISEKRSAYPAADASRNVFPSNHSRGAVPLISWVQAGEPDAAADCGEISDWLPCNEPHSKHTYALRVDGDSMTAPAGAGVSFPHGINIFVDPEQRGGVVPGEFIIAKLDGQDAVTFKQLAREDGRSFLRPLNPNYPPIFQSFRILGKVIYAGFSL